jgi:ABC transporter transmembrane region
MERGDWKEESELGLCFERQCQMVVLVGWHLESNRRHGTAHQSVTRQSKSSTTLFFPGTDGRQAIIIYAGESYLKHQNPALPYKTPTLGKGIGLAFSLLILQIISSMGSNHFFYRSTSTGVLLRGGLITAIYSRSLRLTARARSTLTNGKLVNHISTDVSRIDFCAGFFHMIWTAPIQMVVCLILLLLNLGPSALAGFAMFILLNPALILAMRQMFKLRQMSMQWTDKRAKLLQELLGGMKIIKFFAWEVPFLNRIFGYRQKEMTYVIYLTFTPSMVSIIEQLHSNIAYHPFGSIRHCNVTDLHRNRHRPCHLLLVWTQIGSCYHLHISHFIQLVKTAHDVLPYVTIVIIDFLLMTFHFQPWPSVLSLMLPAQHSVFMLCLRPRRLRRHSSRSPIFRTLLKFKAQHSRGIAHLRQHRKRKSRRDPLRMQRKLQKPKRLPGKAKQTRRTSSR